MGRPPIQRVTFADLRTLFNREVLPRITNGELLEIVRSEGQANPKMGQPPGTLSQRVEYWATVGGKLEKTAVVHRYLRPDGTLGASGLPDPKMVLHNGIRYAPHPKPPGR
jgi:hypothetical protein